MLEIVEEYGMVAIEAMGGAVALGAIAVVVRLLIEHGSALLDLVF